MLLAFFSALSVNLDTILISVVYGLKKVKINFRYVLLIALFTSIITFISIYLGHIIVNIINYKFIEYLGSLILIFIGIYAICDTILNKKNTVLNNPMKADLDNSFDINLKESLLLSFVLSINNFGVGFSLGLINISPLLISINTFLFTIIFFYLGYFLAYKFKDSKYHNILGILAGIIMIIIGIFI